MDARDNERHFKAWLDKSSWRKDLGQIKRDYGPKPQLTDEFTVDVRDVVRYLGEAIKDRPHAHCSTSGCCAPIRPVLKGRWLCTVCEELKS